MSQLHAKFPQGVPFALCLLLVALAIVPLLWPEVPPLTDLPGHMARFMIQLDAGRSADLARWYSFEWNLLPNLGTDLIVQTIGPLIGLAPAMKLVVILIVGLQVAGYLLLSRTAHGRAGAMAVFAIPLALGNPFQFGFLNFTLGTALATLALAAWMTPALATAPRRRWWLFCLIASVIWICHLAAWAVLCVLVGCCELAVRYERSRRFWRSLAGGFLASSCLLVPQLISLAWPHPSGHMPTDIWFEMGIKLYHFANVLADRWAMWDIACAAVLVGVVAWCWRSSAFVIHKGLALGASVLMGLFLVMPDTIYGSSGADMHLMPMIYALALIAACPSPMLRASHQRWLLCAALAFALLRLAGNTVSMAAWDNRIRAEQAVLDNVPQGSQLLTFVALPCRPIMSYSRLRNTHVGSYALIRRRAFANDQWAMQGGQLLSIHNPAVGPFTTADTSTVFVEPCHGVKPFLSVLQDVPATVPMVWVIWHAPELPLPGWSVARRSGSSVLYRRGVLQEAN